MKNSIYLFVTLLLVGCSTRKEIEPMAEKKNDDCVAFIGDITKQAKPLKISSVKIVGNSLIVEVNYSGGCKNHVFETKGSPMIAKSLPPIRAVQIIDLTKDDLCKKMEIKTLSIDISELAYKKEKGSEIYLTIEGWDEKIKYIFE